MESCVQLIFIKVMLHKTIRNKDFWCNTALQICWVIFFNSDNLVPILERCVALKNVFAKNRIV